MDFRKQGLSIKEVKETDMVSYLSGKGYEPAKIRGNDYWYYSPLREERTASFKINRRLNRWYDHGIGKGGNLIDFGILFYNCSVKDFLQQFPASISFHQQVTRTKPIEILQSRITILDDFSISSFPLLRYLRQRKIPFDIADLVCREVRFVLNEKTYYTIGFRNDAGGYELRNEFLQLSSFPKDMTTIKNGAKEVAVFEGFFDFLSFLPMSEDTGFSSIDFLVLNSLSFFEKARPVMESYERIRLFLDNDKAGQNCSLLAIANCKKYSDMSSLYKGYKDLNDWLINNKHDKADSG